MRWFVPDFHNFTDFFGRIAAAEGSDCSPVNMILLQKKYSILTAFEGGFLFRYYSGGENRSGYAFPLRIAESECACTDAAQPGAQNSFDAAVSAIVDDAKTNGRALKFCLLTEAQKNLVAERLGALYGTSLEWATDRNDSDYIYDRRKLAELAGKTYHKKKNHVSRFLRIHDGEWEFRSLSLCDIADDMIFVARNWLEERLGKETPEPAASENSREERRVLESEFESIQTAVANKTKLGLEGGTLYIRGKPVAMTLASKISRKLLDVHFEKCLQEAAADGGYAVINWCFAHSCDGYDFLNREEDMGVEGLRKAKLSYHPETILDKFYSR